MSGETTGMKNKRIFIDKNVRRLMEEKIKQIEKLGKELVICSFDKTKCPGVDNCPLEGKIPRCINLYPRTPLSLKEGVIVIGMNPGNATKGELKIYLESIKNGRVYESHKEYMDDVAFNHNAKHYYHKETKEVLKILGFYDSFDSPILWTEIVKCQSEKGMRGLRINTIRNCVAKYLRKEIEIFPEWPLICLGNEAFRTCALLFPDRTVIGIPHPSRRNRTKFNDFKRYIFGNSLEVKEKIKRSKESAISLANKRL